MGTRYRQAGGVVEYTNSTGSAIAADAIIKMEDMIGIALVDIPDGESGSVAIEGVFEVPKTAGAAWTQGDKLDWDASAGSFAEGVTPASGDVEDCCVAFEAAASAATTGLVKLTPGTGTGTP